MDWQSARATARARYVNKYDLAEAKAYDDLVGTLSAGDADAYLADLGQVNALSNGQRVLDVGAGTGTLSQLLTRIQGLSIVAMEPSPNMLALLREKPELTTVETVEGFCDAPADRNHFPACHFDVVISRQLVNGLFDPLAAFRNWMHWLVPGGVVVILDGIYDRDSWRGSLEPEADLLPLACNQSLALAPYLLETVGFEIRAVEWMRAVNLQPSTRTKRYLVSATKPQTHA